jgi:hypothetical protein
MDAGAGMRIRAITAYITYPPLTPILATYFRLRGLVRK